MVVKLTFRGKKACDIGVFSAHVWVEKCIATTCQSAVGNPGSNSDYPRKGVRCATPRPTHDSNSPVRIWRWGRFWSVSHLHIDKRSPTTAPLFTPERS